MGIYFGDLHNHCGITYGFGSLENALEEAGRHLDFCAVTGHAMWPDMPADDDKIQFIVEYHQTGFQKLSDHWESVRDMVNSFNTENFVTFQGYEMHSNQYGDYHIVSPDDNLELLYAESPEELVNKIRKTSRAIAVPHHMGYVKGFRGMDWSFFCEDISPIAEVYSKHGCGMDDDAAYPYYHTMGPRAGHGTASNGLRLGHQFSFVASTDHHAGYPGSYGDGRIAVYAAEKTREAIWDGIIKGHTYAVTGDKIKCDFTLNGHIFGSKIKSKGKRELNLKVIGSDAIDKITVYKNSSEWKTELVGGCNGDLASAYKIRVEFGWGDSKNLTKWKGEITVDDGTLLSVEPCFRGISVLSPSKDMSSNDDINKLDNKVYDVTENSLKILCSTAKNNTTLHPQTSSVVLEICGNETTAIRLNVNGIEKIYALSSLIENSEGFFTEGFTSPAVLVHKAVPNTLYEREFTWYDEPGIHKQDYYYCEVRQKNMQFAWISPIFVDELSAEAENT